MIANKKISRPGDCQAPRSEGIEPNQAHREVMAYNDKLFLRAPLRPRLVALYHSPYPNEQIVYIVRGQIKVSCQGTTPSTLEPAKLSWWRGRRTWRADSRKILCNRWFTPAARIHNVIELSHGGRSLLMRVRKGEAIR